MSMENPELEEINHLLEVEKQASALIEEAMSEADKRLSEAHAKFNEQVKVKSEEITARLTKEYDAALEQIKQNHEKTIEAYKSDLENKEVNQEAFNSLLDKILFGV